MIGLAEYTAGQKKNWRGWQWNRIVERLSVYMPTRDATVLYLCGPEDEDREKALARGFRNENIIAVDLVEEYVQRVRKSGGFGIAHELGDLLAAWPVDWPIHVIVADFCGGLDHGAARFAQGLVRCPMTMNPDPPVVMAVNLQRGRDAASNGMRHFWSDKAEIAQWALQCEVHDPQKHRGWQFFLGYLGLQARELADALRVSLVDLEPQLYRPWGMTCPVFNSYRSSKVMMDTAVFTTTPFRLKSGRLNPGVVVQNDSVAAARRKIAALRAVRTAKARAA